MSMYGKGSPRPVGDTGPGLTRGEVKDECDVNNIVKRHTRDGFVAHINRGVPVFMDVSEVGDFRTAIDQVRGATEFFGKLPSRVRSKFGNDPARFIDEAGRLSRDELRELGLAELRKSDRQRRAEDAEEAAPVGAASGTVAS